MKQAVSLKRESSDTFSFLQQKRLEREKRRAEREAEKASKLPGENNELSTPIGDKDTNMADDAEKGMDQSGPSEPVRSGRASCRERV